jgi:RimJ/RimL family protein N-acetyltransferase
VIPAGLLHGDPGTKPERHIFVEHEAPWMPLTDSLPRLTGPELREWRKQHGYWPSAPLAWRELRTSRLHLRRPHASDAELIFTGFGADPEVMRYLSWRPHASLAAAEAAMARRLERLENGVEYSWILEANDSGAAVGLVSGWRQGDAFELGFSLARPFWNRGLMTEAASAVRDWAFGAGLRRIWATCDVENRASARVLEKAGLAPRGRFERGTVRPNLGPEPRPSLYFSSER